MQAVYKYIHTYSCFAIRSEDLNLLPFILVIALCLTQTLLLTLTITNLFLTISINETSFTIYLQNQPVELSDSAPKKVRDKMSSLCIIRSSLYRLKIQKGKNRSSV